MRRIVLFSAAFLGSVAFPHGTAAGAPCFMPPPIGITRAVSAEATEPTTDCYVNALVRKKDGLLANTVRRCLPRDEPMPYASSAAELPVDAEVVDAARECASRVEDAPNRDESYVLCVRRQLAPEGYAVIAR